MFYNYNLYNNLIFFLIPIKTYSNIFIFLYFYIYLITCFIIIFFLIKLNFKSNNVLILIKKLYFNVFNYKYFQLSILNFVGLPPLSTFVLKVIFGIVILCFTNIYFFISYFFINIFSFFYYLQFLKLFKKNKIVIFDYNSFYLVNKLYFYHNFIFYIFIFYIFIFFIFFVTDFFFLFFFFF